MGVLVVELKVISAGAEGFRLTDQSKLCGTSCRESLGQSKGVSWVARTTALADESCKANNVLERAINSVLIDFR